MSFLKRISLVLLFLFAAGLVFASGKGEEFVPSAATAGLSEGAITALSSREKPIKYDSVIKTKYFDIIYPAQSEITAQILASRVDALYEKAAAEFETDAWMHFPIIIQPSTQIFNAYYTSSPYNHIMLLDTPNNSSSLAVEAETIVNTFYHELVHAVTANIHNKSWKNRNNIFGDFYSIPFLLNSKLFTIEGATVSMESRDGEGRVNSGEAMSPVIQAKLEGKFPEWRDISGPRDIYPAANGSYVFGGAFNAWLQNEYGMSTYADFWKECSTINFKGFTGIFKKVYGFSLDQAWEEFSRTVPVPEVEAEEKRTTIEEEARFASLAVRPGTESGIVYSRNAGSVRYLAIGDPGEQRDKELFSCAGSPGQFSFSSDGRLLAVSGYMTGTTEAYSVRIFDMESGRFCGAEIPYSRNAVITDGADGKKYIMCLESAASYLFVSRYLLDDILNAESSCPEPLSRLELPVFDEIYDTAAVPGGAACLRKTDGVWYITVAGLDGTVSSWQLPDDTVPVGLSSAESSDGSILLYTAVSSKGMNTGSETEPGALSRFAVISIKDGNATLSFQKRAFSGGTHNPAVTKGGTVYSIARLYESDSLCSYRSDATDMTAPVALKSTTPVPKSTEQTAFTNPFKAEKYKPLSYMFRGVVFPIPGIIVSPISSSVQEGGLGATFWTATPDGSVNFQFSGGTSLDVGDGSVPGSAFGLGPIELYATVFGDNTRLAGGRFVWDLAGKLTLNTQYEITELYGRAAFGEVLTLSNDNETVSFINGTEFYDRTLDPDLGSDTNHEIRNVVQDMLSAEYSHYTKKGMTEDAFSGFSLGTNFLYQYGIKNTTTHDVETDTELYDEVTYGNIGLSGGFSLARLLPFAYRSKLTYNLPFSFSASLFGSPQDFVNASAEFTLFSAEIQKGISVVPFYCNRFKVTAGWAYWTGISESGQSFSSFSIFNLSDIWNDMDDYSTVEAITGGINFVMSPDIGNINSVQFNLGVNGYYYLRNEIENKKYDISILGIFSF